MKLKLEILYEDDNIICINKPAEVLTIPDRYDTEIFNLYNYLQKIYGNVYTVHRLDRGTSGAIIFAKDDASHRNLNAQFQENDVKKVYRFVVEGIIPKDEIDIDIPISPSPFKKGESIPSARGKASLTILRVLKRYRNATYCECDLITGRHHQLRVHVAAIGFPLLVDDMYGEKEDFYVSTMKKKNFNLKKKTEERPIIDRITMHAFSLEFNHPLNNEVIKIEASYPKDFKALLQVLEKYGAIKHYSH